MHKYYIIAIYKSCKIILINILLFNKFIIFKFKILKNKEKTGYFKAKITFMINHIPILLFSIYIIYLKIEHKCNFLKTLIFIRYIITKLKNKKIIKIEEIIAFYFIIK